MNGITNKFLIINLSDKKSIEYYPGTESYEKFIGGRGLAGKLFTERVSPGADPLSAENCMVFSTGPVTGTSIPTSGRFALVTKSPLTNTIFYSNIGGFAGVFLKRCGIDGFIIEDKSEKPVYIIIDENGGVVFKNAESLWGLNPDEVSLKIKQNEGENVSILMIGIGGENLVKFSSVINDTNRTFGRGGVGAVMGSKMLKAIVIKHGEKRTHVHDKELLKKYVKNAVDKIKVAPVTNIALPNYGTPGLVNIINNLGMFPVNNYKYGSSKFAVNVSGEALSEKKYTKCETCYNCPIKCGRSLKNLNNDENAPEYESLWALGPNCGIFDLNAIILANNLCNSYGLDTISTGSTIACAMELQENNRIKNDNINFGDADSLLKLIHKIATKEGIGKELAEGSKSFSAKYNSPESSMQVKGLELPGYDPRGAMGQALGYATSNRGGCHLTGYMVPLEIFSAPKKVERFTLGGKSDLLVLKQNQNAIEDSLSVCKFLSYALGFEYYSRFMKAVTGKEFTVSKLLEAGDRIYNLERLFNIGAGFSKKDDNLPERFIKSPLKEGLSKDHVVDVNKMLVDYYDVRKWDTDGIPTKEKLTELGLPLKL
jgi:aldehyde:ferredoxin oxidoreductase